MNESSGIKDFVRGGQIILHHLRMLRQVILRVFLVTAIIVIAVNVFWLKQTTTPYERYVSYQWMRAHYLTWINPKAKQKLRQPDGEYYPVYSKDILRSPEVKETIQRLKSRLLEGLLAGSLGYLFVFILISWWLKQRGKNQTEDKYIKGDYLGSVSEITKKAKQLHKTPTWHIGIEKLPIPHWAELQHMFMHGTTGSGKSTTIKEILDHIRRRGDRAIIYDKSCNLVKQFYQPKVDVLMNVLDARGVDWGLWKECRDKADLESIAAALMPMPPTTQDPFWINAARTIFAAAANRIRKEFKNPKILPLLRYLLTADIDELKSLLKGTEAESLMSEKTEKTAISVKSVMATYLKSLCYIQDGDEPFSIRKWIQDDTSNQWLFISSQGDKHESLKPLITAWLGIALNALLSLSENPERRIWIILDELASLQQLPDLENALSEARKFGGCFVLGVQNYAQLCKVYGHEGAKDISSLLSSRFLFRVPDPDIAAWSAKNLGETTHDEVREGVSYGAGSSRDGVSLNQTERNKVVVTPSEIMRLDNLACYVRLPGEYPIAKIHVQYVKRSDKNEPFIQRKIENDDLRAQVQELVEHFDELDPVKAPQKFKKEAREKKSNKQSTKESNKKLMGIDEQVDEQSLDI